MRILAIDIGGTAIKYGLFENQQLIIIGQFPIRNTNGTENLPEKLCELIANYPAESISVSAPGPFDFSTGTSYIPDKLLSLYNVCLKDCIKGILPEVNVKFFHDLTSFAVGVLNLDNEPIKGKFACITLGTGLGYTCIEDGKVLLNEQRRPLKSLWSVKIFDGVAEDYVSTKRFLESASALGYSFDNVYELSLAARRNKDELLNIFERTGECLALAVNKMWEMQRIERIVIGGQISKSFDLMRSGFERFCDIPYRVVQNPERYPIYGLMTLSESGKHDYCKICIT